MPRLLLSSFEESNPHKGVQLITHIHRFPILGTNCRPKIFREWKPCISIEQAQIFYPCHYSHRTVYQLFTQYLQWIWYCKQSRDDYQRTGGCANVFMVFGSSGLMSAKTSALPQNPHPNHGILNKRHKHSQILVLVGDPRSNHLQLPRDDYISESLRMACQKPYLWKVLPLQPIGTPSFL